MNRRVPVLALVAFLAVVGCSSQSSTSTTASTTPATSAPKSTPKAEVIAKGDKICQDANADKSEPASTSSADLEAFLKKGLASQRETIKQIEALGPPDTDADAFAAAIAKAKAYTDLLEKAVPDIAANPKGDFADLKKTQDAADKAARDFGFKVCGASSSSSSSDTTAKNTTTTESGASSGDSTAKAKELLAGFGPTRTFTAAQISCVATGVFEDRALAATATNVSAASVTEKKALYRKIVECAGPEVAIDTFMTGVMQSKNPPTETQAACVRAYVEGLSLDAGVSLLAGEDTALTAFGDHVKTNCGV